MTVDDDVRWAGKWWLDLATDVPADVVGLWFGLFVRASAGGPAEHQMYVCGTPSFSADDGGDWACDYVWVPDARYLRLPGLAAIPTAHWQAALDHAVGVVTSLAPWQSSPSGVLGVGVGFDDGDVMVVWART